MNEFLLFVLLPLVGAAICVFSGSYIVAADIHCVP